MLEFSLETGNVVEILDISTLCFVPLICFHQFNVSGLVGYWLCPRKTKSIVGIRLCITDLNYTYEMCKFMLVMKKVGINQRWYISFVLYMYHVLHCYYVLHWQNVIEYRKFYPMFHVIIITGKPTELYRNRLGAFGVSGELATRPVSSLSGGQKSRVAFAVIDMLKWVILINVTHFWEAFSFFGLENCKNTMDS